MRPPLQPPPRNREAPGVQLPDGGWARGGVHGGTPGVGTVGGPRWQRGSAPLGSLTLSAPPTSRAPLHRQGPPKRGDPPAPPCPHPCTEDPPAPPGSQPGWGHPCGTGDRHTPGCHSDKAPIPPCTSLGGHARGSPRATAAPGGVCARSLSPVGSPRCPCGHRCPTGPVTSPRPRLHKQHVAKTNGCSSGGSAAAPARLQGPGHRAGDWHTPGARAGGCRGAVGTTTRPRGMAAMPGAKGMPEPPATVPGGARAVSGIPQNTLRASPTVAGSTSTAVQEEITVASPQPPGPAPTTAASGHGAQQGEQDTPNPGRTHCQGPQPRSQGTASPHGLSPEHPQSPHHSPPWAPQRLPRAGRAGTPHPFWEALCHLSLQHSRAGKG